MLNPGTRLGPYEIVAPIGQGGMGEVYRARDTRLHRTVAIKVLLQEFAADPERRQRFEREARAVAALNHQHICALYDVGHQDGIDFLVLEHLDGQSLADRLAAGPLPLPDALRIGIAITDALGKAHRAGIVHRDLKPGNVMLTKAGVKLLDFGLASLRPVEALSGASVAMTRADLTADGMVLGTLQYMAPEQLEGLQADARSDIFAFGAVLFEMIAGRKAFRGNARMSLVSAILRDMPPPLSTPPDVEGRSPSGQERLQAVDRVIATCLAKDPDDRWQSANDLGKELRRIADGDTEGGQHRQRARASMAAARRVPLWTAALAAATAALAAGAGVWTLKPGPATAAPSSPVIRATIALPEGERLGNTTIPSIAWSPDGSALAYTSVRDLGTPQIYFRALASAEARLIPGTERASVPFFSPDGQWIGFFADGKLKKVLARGGAPQTLCDATNGLGGSWGPDETVYFAPFGTSGLWKVSAAGGTPEAVSTLDRSLGETSHRWPQVLPGGQAILYTVWTGPGWDEHQLQVLNLENGEHHVLVKGANGGTYVPSGHLVYTRADVVMAVPFDPGRLQVTGSPVALDERALDDDGVQHAESTTGILAYLAASPRRTERQLLWVDQKGTVEALPVPPRPYTDPSISHDGRFVAVSVMGPVQTIWVYDLARRTMTPLTSEATGSSQAPVWTPDGKRVLFRGTRAGFRNVFWKAADGSGDEERLTMSDNLQTPSSVAGDGRYLAFIDVAPATGWDIWTMALEGREQEKFLATGFREQSPMFSPDGRLIAYTSYESGTGEIYVRPFPESGARMQVSTNGGSEPTWSQDGRQIFYRSGDRMMAAAIVIAPTLSAGSPRVLFEGQYKTTDTGGTPGYALAPDGRFLMVQSVERGQPATHVNLVINWFDELRRRAPATR